MQIVTDRGSDFASGQLEDLEVHYVPMRLELDGKTYSSGEDLTSEAFYELLEKTDGFPVTSQATPADFAALYRRLAQKDPEILSMHISSGLSGTMGSARLGAEMVPEARVTIWDSMTLSCPEAWQVEAAGKAIKAGWPLERVLNLLERIRSKTEGIFTLDALKYLIHGGRISHMKGLIASMLHIRPVIAVEKANGKYYTLAQEMTMKRAIQKVADSMLRFYAEGSRLRVQLLNGKNPEAMARLRDVVAARFDCHWVTPVSIGPILGAHTGPSLVGICAAPLEVFENIL
jgi:DegV family protein with EDD domain